MKNGVWSVAWTLAFIGAWACTERHPLESRVYPAQRARAGGSAEQVSDLYSPRHTTTSITLRWTQVGDGSGKAAWYEVLVDGATRCADPIKGDAIGDPIGCDITGLEPSTTHTVRVGAHRRGGGWENATMTWSDPLTVSTDEPAPEQEPDTTTTEDPDTTVTEDPDTTTTEDPDTVTTPDPEPVEGIWLSESEIMDLPMSGEAWAQVRDEADADCGTPDVSDQDDDSNVCILATALAYVRTGDDGYRAEVVDALRSIASEGTYDGRALSLGRELAAYVIAADLVGLSGAADEAFRDKLIELRTTYTDGAASSLVDCHEKRPNNWGTHCGASRAAIAIYLGDADDLDRTAQVFRGYLGDRASYAGFSYGDLSWQCDPDRPVGVNPAGCTRDGHSIDGVLPDDQRRGGSFSWPPPKENYAWEALQGALVQATILHRAGYDVWAWEDRALLRAVQWLHEQAEYPAEGDDEWQPHLVNYAYGSSFPAVVPARHGKNMGWTDWTHGAVLTATR